MNLSAWLRHRKVMPEDVGLFTIGTDGLKATKDNLMSVSFKDKTFKHVFFPGAHPENTEKFTGIGPETYNKLVMDEEDAVKTVSDFLNSKKLLITYNTAFCLPFINKKLEVKTPIVDILDIIVFQEAGGVLPHDVRTIQEALDLISQEVIYLPRAYFHLAVSVKVEREFPGPPLLSKIDQLHELCERVLLQ